MSTKNNLYLPARFDLFVNTDRLWRRRRQVRLANGVADAVTGVRRVHSAQASGTDAIRIKPRQLRIWFRRWRRRAAQRVTPPQSHISSTLGSGMTSDVVPARPVSW